MIHIKFQVFFEKKKEIKMLSAAVMICTLRIDILPETTVCQPHWVKKYFIAHEEIDDDDYDELLFYISFNTKSYRDDERMIMKDCVQWSAILPWAQPSF